MPPRSESPESLESFESEPLYLKFDGDVQGQKQRSSFHSKRFDPETMSSIDSYSPEII